MTNSIFLSYCYKWSFDFSANVNASEAPVTFADFLLEDQGKIAVVVLGAIVLFLSKQIGLALSYIVISVKCCGILCRLVWSMSWISSRRVQGWAVQVMFTKSLLVRPHFFCILLHRLLLIVYFHDLSYRILCFRDCLNCHP